jgi:hypothetical protein
MSQSELHDLLDRVASQSVPVDLIPSVNHRVRIARRRRVVLGGVAALLVAAGAVGGAVTVHRDTQSPFAGVPPRIVVGVGATHEQIEEVAARYFDLHLHVTSSHVTGFRDGDGLECAAVAVQAPDGRTRGVAVVLQDSPMRWEAVGMSSHYRISDYIDSGDVQCGLYNAVRRAQTTTNK